MPCSAPQGSKRCLCFARSARRHSIVSRTASHVSASTIVHHIVLVQHLFRLPSDVHAMVLLFWAYEQIKSVSSAYRLYLGSCTFSFLWGSRPLFFGQKMFRLLFAWQIVWNYESFSFTPSAVVNIRRRGSVGQNEPDYHVVIDKLKRDYVWYLYVTAEQTQVDLGTADTSLPSPGSKAASFCNLGGVCGGGRGKGGLCWM